MVCTNQNATTASVIRLPDADEKPKRMGIYKYLSQFPKEQQKKIFDDLVEQGRVFTELTDMGLIGFVQL
jgi:hypothetical protein